MILGMAPLGTSPLGTGSSGGGVVPPAFLAPANLRGTPYSDRIVWEWDPVDSAEGYMLEFGVLGGPYFSFDSGPMTTYTKFELLPSTAYVARVRAYR